jgi:SAM-dependent methyltransferase
LAISTGVKQVRTEKSSGPALDRRISKTSLFIISRDAGGRRTVAHAAAAPQASGPARRREPLKGSLQVAEAYNNSALTAERHPEIFRSDMAKAIYIHGTNRSEQARLKLLNALTNGQFINFLDIEETSSVLEVGSGLGMLAQAVARLVPRGEIYGVEYSPEQLARAESPLPNLRFVQGDAHALGFEDNRFDVVYCRYVLEHLAGPLQALREMYRVLKPGGRVFVQENNILANVLYPECPRFDALWRRFSILQERLGGDALIGKKLLPLLKQAGFEGIELSVQPEIHHSGRESFRPWMENLLGNVEGAADQLIEQRLATLEEVEAAVAELKAFVERDDASAFFYWNRASGAKPI